MVNIKKAEQVSELQNLLKEASNFALVKFDKTTHKALEQLRKDLKKSDATLRVVKNTLLEKALGNNEHVKKVFPIRENTALLMLGSDYAKGLSTFFKFTKTDASLSFKFGVLDDSLYLGPELEKIAQLPSKDELIAKLIGGLKSPSSKLVYAMKFNISKLTLVLKERAKQTN